MDDDIKDIFEAAMLEIEVNHKIGTNHQGLVEESILNLAALKVLRSNTNEEILGN